MEKKKEKETLPERLVICGNMRNGHLDFVVPQARNEEFHDYCRLFSVAPIMRDIIREAEEQSRKRLPVKKATWLKMQAVLARIGGN